MSALNVKNYYRQRRKLTTYNAGNQMRPQIPSPETISLLSQKDRFLSEFKFAHPTSSFSTYQSWINHFLVWLASAKNIAEPTLADFSEEVLDDYLHYHMTRPPQKVHLCHKNGKKPKTVSPNTVRNAFHPLRAFGRWLVAKKLLAADPMDSVNIPSKDESGERPVGDEESLRLLLKAVLRNTDPKARALDFAIVMLLTNSMMRNAEVAKAELADLDLDEGRLQSQSKGRKFKKKYSYYFNEATADALRSWLSLRPKNCAHDYIFCHGPRRGISDDYIRGIIHRYADEAGVPDASGLLPHALKHLGARRLAEAGWELSLIADRCAHAKVTTTLMHYLHANQDRVKQSREVGIDLRESSVREEIGGEAQPGQAHVRDEPGEAKLTTDAARETSDANQAGPVASPSNQEFPSARLPARVHRGVIKRRDEDRASKRHVRYVEVRPGERRAA